MKELYLIRYFNNDVQNEIMSLPEKLQARYLSLSKRIVENGPNLGLPHTEAFGGGLFELRLKSMEGIVRVFFCLLIGKEVMMLHAFAKKSQKTPDKEIRVAKLRMRIIKNEY